MTAVRSASRLGLQEDGVEPRTWVCWACGYLGMTRTQALEHRHREGDQLVTSQPEPPAPAGEPAERIASALERIAAVLEALAGPGADRWWRQARRER